MNGYHSNLNYYADVKEIYMNQGLMEKKKDGSGSVRITNSLVLVSGKDFAGPFQMRIPITNILDVENHVVYIDGLRRENKNFTDIRTLIDGNIWHIGLKVKDTNSLFNAIQVAMITN